MQARVAARHRIPLDTALGSFTMAKEHLTELVLAEAVELGVSDLASVRTAMAAQSAAFERLFKTAGEEYKVEAGSRPSSPEAGRAERVERLLAGERVDPSPLHYELEGHHLGLFAGSAEARSLVVDLAKEIGCISLVISRSSDELCAWLGKTREPLDPERVRNWITRKGSGDLPVAIGEPGSGYEGWRQTHEQVRSALWFARAKEGPIVEYADVVMLVAARRDQLTMNTLRERYLLPLADDRNGRDIRAALRAYFSCDKNKTAAAKTLNVSRQTLNDRIKRAEALFGERLIDCEDALYVALTLEELGCFPNLPHSLP
jgi:predicted DNA-binding protein YlxM (UPF0122 family)